MSDTFTLPSLQNGSMIQHPHTTYHFHAQVSLPISPSADRKIALSFSHKEMALNPQVGKDFAMILVTASSAGTMDLSFESKEIARDL